MSGRNDEDLLFSAVRLYAQRAFGASYVPEKISITLRGLASPVKLPIPPPSITVPLNGTFVPNAFQKGILKALAGKALRADELGLAVGDRRRLFRKPGGVSELQEHGLVSHHQRLGYYLTDDPPDDLPAEEEPQED